MYRPPTKYTYIFASSTHRIWNVSGNQLISKRTIWFQNRKRIWTYISQKRYKGLWIKWIQMLSVTNLQGKTHQINNERSSHIY